MPTPLSARGVALLALGTSLFVSTRFSDAFQLASPGRLTLPAAQQYAASSSHLLPTYCSTAVGRAGKGANTVVTCATASAFAGTQLGSVKSRCCAGRLLVMSSSEDGDVEGGVEGGDDGDGSEMAVVVEGEVTRSAQVSGGNGEEVEIIASGDETRCVRIFLACVGGRERVGQSYACVIFYCVFDQQRHITPSVNGSPLSLILLVIYNNIKHDYSNTTA